MGQQKITRRQVIDAASQVNVTTNRMFSVTDYGSVIGIYDQLGGEKFKNDAEGYAQALAFLWAVRAEYVAEQAVSEGGPVYCGHPDCLGYYLPHEH